MRTLTSFCLLALLPAACNVYDESLLGRPPGGSLGGSAAGSGMGGTTSKGGAAGSLDGSGGASGSAGAGSTGGAQGEGGIAGAGGNGGNAGASGGGGGGGSAGSSGSVGSGGSGGSAGTGGAGTGGAGTGGAGTGGAGPVDAAVDVVGPRDVGPDIAPIIDASADTRPDVQDAAPEVFIDPDAPPCAGTALNLVGPAQFAQLNRPIQDDFTMEAWIKTTTPMTGMFYWEGRGLFFADVGGGNNDFAVSILNDKLAFGVGNPPNADLQITGTSTVTTGQWVHVAVTRTRSTGALQLLVNGTVEAELASSMQVNSLTASSLLTMGRNTNSGANFVGLIDEIRLWSVVRSAADIALTMHQGLVGNETGLVGYWKFDDVGTAHDSSPNNLPTTLSGAPTWSSSNALCAF